MKFYIVPEDELMHYGVPGMRRGVRKYTNPDGTLNAAGRARYAKEKLKSRIKKNVQARKRVEANAYVTGVGIKDENVYNAKEAIRKKKDRPRWEREDKPRIEQTAKSKAQNMGIRMRDIAEGKREKDDLVRGRVRSKARQTKKSIDAGALVRNQAARQAASTMQDAKRKRNLAKKIKKKVKRWNSPISVYTNKR